VSEALVLLVILWAAAMVPSAVRARNASPHVTVGGFERAMEVLRNEQRATPGRRVMVPADPERIVQRAVRAPSPGPGRRFRREDPRIARRRAWFERLLVVSVAAIAVGLVLGGWYWFLTGVVVSATLGYTIRLRRLKVQRDEARRVVREFDRGLDGGLEGAAPADRAAPAGRVAPADRAAPADR
jgi:hypothetical protein